MKLLKYLIVLFALLRSVDEADSACTLSLNKDFGVPSPVYLQNGDYLTPNSNSEINLQRSETILVACPGDKRHVVVGTSGTYSNVLEAHCIINDTFRVERWIGSFKDIKCNHQPWFTAEDTGRRCYGVSKVFRVGYKVQNKFFTLYEACFDGDQYATHYVVHQVAPGAKISQVGGSRFQFIEGGLFGKVRMAELYKAKNQKKRLDEVLGQGMGEKYVTNKQFLTRGHLAARADFGLRAEHRASFHFVNTAPQWMRGNAGDWAALEDAIRRRVDSNGSPLTIVTGTYRVMTLPDSKGRHHEIYLDVDANNNGIVPVPMYFFKLVYDPIKKTAAAFVSINSSYYNCSTVEQLTFCDAECSRHNWLKWRSNDGTHSFCCDYKDLVNTVSFLPTLDVRGVFV